MTVAKSSQSLIPAGTMLNLPVGAAGQTVRLRAEACATGTGTSLVLTVKRVELRAIRAEQATTTGQTTTTRPTTTEKRDEHHGRHDRTTTTTTATAHGDDHDHRGRRRPPSARQDGLIRDGAWPAWRRPVPPLDGREAARYSSGQVRHSPAGFACGKGVVSGTLAGCADVPHVRAPAHCPHACIQLISHVLKGGFFS